MDTVLMIVGFWAILALVAVFARKDEKRNRFTTLD